MVESLTTSNNNPKETPTGNGADTDALRAPKHWSLSTSMGKRDRIVKLCPSGVVAEADHMVASWYSPGTTTEAPRNGKVESIIGGATYSVLRSAVWTWTSLYNHKYIVHRCNNGKEAYGKKEARKGGGTGDSQSLNSIETYLVRNNGYGHRNGSEEKEVHNVEVNSGEGRNKVYGRSRSPKSRSASGTLLVLVRTCAI